MSDRAGDWPAASPAHESRTQPTTPDDVRVLDRALELLADERTWNPECNRDCPEGAVRWSLFCALQRSCIDVWGQYRRRCAAIQYVRFAIEAAAPGDRFAHRLRDFNNRHSFAEVSRALRDARDLVAARVRDP